MEWMSAIDSSFLHIENDVTPMHIGGVSLFEGPPPPFADLMEMVASKLDLVPRYRQKVRFMPLGAGAPAWVDDPHFSLDYHVRHTAVPAPGSEEQLRNMAARVFSQHLDRNKPLWELWSVEGLADGRWALLSKVHHCMVDGVAATDLMSVMFSDTTGGGQRRVFSPPPEPSSVELLARTVAHKVSPKGISCSRCAAPCRPRGRRCAPSAKRPAPRRRPARACGRSPRTRSPARSARTGAGPGPTCA